MALAMDMAQGCIGFAANAQQGETRMLGAMVAVSNCLKPDENDPLHRKRICALWSVHGAQANHLEPGENNP
jgi:hypothetical protein